MQDGFQNWKKGRERLERHEKSECHRDVLYKLNKMQGSSAIIQLNSEAMRTQAMYRSMLIKQLSGLNYLLRQGTICLWTHREREWNHIQLLKLQSDDCAGNEA